MLDYAERHIAHGGRLHHVTRHMVGLFQGVPGARRWRQILSSDATAHEAGPEVIERAYGEIEADPHLPRNKHSQQKLLRNRVYLKSEIDAKGRTIVGEEKHMLSGPEAAWRNAYETQKFPETDGRNPYCFRHGFDALFCFRGVQTVCCGQETCCPSGFSILQNTRRGQS